MICVYQNIHNTEDSRQSYLKTAIIYFVHITFKYEGKSTLSIKKIVKRNSKHQTPNLHQKESLRNFPDRIKNCENDKFTDEPTELFN